MQAKKSLTDEIRKYLILVKQFDFTVPHIPTLNSYYDKLYDQFQNLTEDPLDWIWKTNAKAVRASTSALKYVRHCATILCGSSRTSHPMHNCAPMPSRQACAFISRTFVQFVTHTKRPLRDYQLNVLIVGGRFILIKMR